MKKDLTCAWQEWHETCELDKCSEQNIVDLCECSDRMFSRAISKIPQGQSSLVQIPRSDEENPSNRQYIQRYTFHLMEGYCLPPGDKEERQQFKNQIFTNAKEPGQVTGYFLRDFFRSYVKSKKNLSYNTPAKPEDNTDREWEDKMIAQRAELAPWYSPDASSADKIDNDEIRRQTQKYWILLNERERAALYTFLSNMTMSAPELLARVGCKKSVFLSLPQKLIEEVNERLSRQMECEKDRIDYLKIFLQLLQLNFDQWEHESELGRWIFEHFPYSERGKKRRFSDGASGKTDF